MTTEAEREYKRRWREDNRERLLEYDRQRREATRERRRADQKRRYWENRDRELEWHRQYYQANRGRILERARKWRAQGNKNPESRYRDEVAARLWHEQGGNCYACEKPVELREVHVDHDHRCCPEGSFCSYCIRGVVHPACNYVLGHAYDDPEHLELIARNLRAKMAEMNERLASKPEQGTLL